MFLGHYGVAFGLKRAQPKLSLGTLFLAAQLPDLLWGIFLLLGWEHARIVPGKTAITPLEFLDYPISHSLLGTLIWSVVAAALYYSWPTRDTSRHWQAAAIVGLAVFSHYPLDVLVHLPDLPLTGNDSAKLGLALWNNRVATLVLEALALGGGLAVYVSRPSNKRPVRGSRILIVTLLLVGTYLASLFGPPPPNMNVVALSDIVFILAMAALAGWADRAASPEELAARRQSRK
ncbi:MAG TPA: hypothetical protein VJ808_12485 [Gemmatimonadales bacterium]|nr:hypothetical protein [Gemmatimonadales bacterium]